MSSNRSTFTGATISPLSIQNVAKRVMPVVRHAARSEKFVYQRLPTNRPVPSASLTAAVGTVPVASESDSGYSPSPAPLVATPYSWADRGDTSVSAYRPSTTSGTWSGRMKPALWKLGATPPAVSSEMVINGDNEASSAIMRSNGVWRVSCARRPKAP